MSTVRPAQNSVFSPATNTSRPHPVSGNWRQGKAFSSPVSRKFSLFALSAGFLLLAACSGDSNTPAGAGQEQAQSVAENAVPAMGAPSLSSPLSSGVELFNLDPNASAQDNFFRFVNGGWLDNTQIPEDRSRWGSFDELNEAADQQVLVIVQEAAASQAAAGSEIQKIGDMYRSFMDLQTLEQRGLTPLQPLLDEIDAIADHDALAAFWASAPLRRLSAPVSFGVGQDQRQSDEYITSMGQSGLGMPDRDFYLSEDARFVTLREQYQAHIARMFVLAGSPEADAADAARRVLALETRLALPQWTRVQNRDRNATYNRLTPRELATLAPGLNWASFLTSAQIQDVPAVVVRQPTYLSALAELYTELALEDWKLYHRYHLLRSAAPYLSDAFVQEQFDFFGRTLNGQPAMRSRERRAVAAVDSAMGFAVGRAYVERHFQPAARERMDTLVKNLLAAFEVAIDELEWMTSITKQEAQQKLASLNTKIAYPEVWQDYNCLQVSADDLLGNILRSTACEHERMMSRLGQPVDREEWFMTPQTVNAYYSPTMNEIVFPAAILQPPFFNVNADDAVNYGAIGAVIGHEITHAFDDQGRRSDGDGNLRDWWAEEDASQFTERAQRMIDQFDQFEPLPGLHIQGALALGENIADLGGLTVAHKAWQLSLNGEPAAEIDGFTGEQRFFLGWGQIWRISFREEALRQQLITGPHSPGMYRVLGPLSNMPEFYQAFGVSETDAMYRPSDVRVKIW
ncbi:MAG: M13 family metallopeptidase [Pseudohongiella sp.]|nr:M13 family metallopeptidase [Pseudohongiella sp.]